MIRNRFAIQRRHGHRTPVGRLQDVVGRQHQDPRLGLLAEQAHGAVTVRYGDTLLLVAVTGRTRPEGRPRLLPAFRGLRREDVRAGKIPGGFIKREGRPTEGSILAARLTDRPLRPLFPKGYRAEVQIVATVLSADQENDPDTLSIIGASAALAISPIPFDGPVAGVRVGLIDGEIVHQSDLHRSSTQ